MKITSKISIIANQDGNFTILNADAHTRDVYDMTSPCYVSLKDAYATMRKQDEADRAAFWDAHSNEILIAPVKAAEHAAKTRPPQEIIKQGISELIDFFTEFAFVPNFRFINVLAHKIAEDKTYALAKQYISSYFALTDSPYAKEIQSKMQCDEFNGILKLISWEAPNKSVNNRFKIYYGAAGSGKTTKAQSETDNRCIVCNASMLPADLMEDFVFAEGKPSFKPSILWECMEQGKPIVLDEINLLPFDSLRFLQGILDGKKEFSYKGHTVTIADGFCVIGTMNLVVNGSVFNLPEPLVDRTMDIKEFNLTAEQLLNAIM